MLTLFLLVLIVKLTWYVATEIEVCPTVRLTYGGGSLRRQ